MFSGLYGLGSVCGGSHVAQVSMEHPVTRQRARNLIAFMVSPRPCLHMDRQSVSGAT